MNTLGDPLTSCFPGNETSISNTTIAAWSTYDCPGVLASIMNSSGTISGAVAYNPSGYTTSTSMFNTFFNSYVNRFTITDDITSTSYNELQEKIIGTCLDSRVPGVCMSAMTDYCSNLSRQDAIGSSSLSSLCGCYVPQDPTYAPYILGTPQCLTGATGCQACTAQSSTCVPQPQCDPLCTRAGTSKKSNPQTGDLIDCPQNVCVLSDVVINSLNSTIPGGVNFNSFCTGCNVGSTLGCRCIVGGSNISNTAASVGIGSQFNQVCGPDSVCLQVDGTSVTVVQCVISASALDNGVTITPYYTAIIIVLVLAIVALILLAAHYFYTRRSIRSTSSNVVPSSNVTTTS